MSLSPPTKRRRVSPSSSSFLSAPGRVSTSSRFRSSNVPLTRSVRPRPSQTLSSRPPPPSTSDCFQLFEIPPTRFYSIPLPLPRTQPQPHPRPRRARLRVPTSGSVPQRSNSTSTSPNSESESVPSVGAASDHDGDDSADSLSLSESFDRRRRKIEEITSTRLLFKKQADAISHLESLIAEHSFLTKVAPSRQLRIVVYQFSQTRGTGGAGMGRGRGGGIGVGSVAPVASLSRIFTNAAEVIPLNPRRLQSRYFGLISFECLWEEYVLMRRQFRHFYEVVRENHPVRLYFDLERDWWGDTRTGAPPGPGMAQEGQMQSRWSDDEEKDVMEMVKSVVWEEMRRHGWVSDGNEISKCVLDLTSSTPHKFSHHLVVCPRMRGSEVVFRSVEDMGYFVKDLCSKLRLEWRKRRRDQSEPHPNDRFFFFNEKGVFKCIIDELVYTKNRHFRMLWSSKAKPGAQMLDVVNVPENSRERDVFYKSLVTNVSVDANPVDCPKQTCLFLGKEELVRGPFRALERASFVPSIRPVRRRQFDPRFHVPSTPLQMGQRDFPKLSEYLLRHIASRGVGAAPFIRSVGYHPSTRCATFYIGGNRYCECIWREHKSNHVFYVVRLASGLFYQKCTDLEHQTFKSKNYLIPPEHMDPIPAIPPKAL